MNATDRLAVGVVLFLAGLVCTLTGATGLASALLGMAMGFGAVAVWRLSRRAAERR